MWKLEVTNNKDLACELEAYVTQIRIPELQAAIYELINSYGNEEKLQDALKVAEIVILIMKEENVINDGPISIVVDFQLATALLHNLFYEYEVSNFKEVFQLREVLKKYEEVIASQPVDAICQSVECQLGKKTPNRLLIPGATTPSSQFALACSFYYKYVK